MVKSSRAPSMRPTLVAAPVPSAFRAARGRQRGAAVFIVLVVVTALAAVGVFATRSASLTATGAGYARQALQNHYATEYGMQAAVTELGSTRAAMYLDLMRNGAGVDGGTATDTCAANAGLAADAGATCVHVTSTDVQTVVAGFYPTRALFDLPAADGGSMVQAGSLGPGGSDTKATPIQGTFDVEVTDLSALQIPVAGAQLNSTVSGGTKNNNYYTVTLTAHGQVRPTLGTNNCNDVAVQTSSLLAGNETGRAVVVVGPAP